jgi:chromosome segregation ATPase
MTVMEPSDSAHPHASTSDASSSPDDLEAKLELSLQEAEDMLQEVKARYAQVKAARSRQIDLTEKAAMLQSDLDSIKDRKADPAEQAVEIEAELESIKTQLVETWKELESQLITWRDQQELFWQFLRFAGIGFIAAFLLKTLVK